MRLIRLRQALVILVGLGVAGVMVMLGLWQLEVYQAQGEDRARSRAALPPVEVSSVARAGEPVSDGYGRPVSVQGRYLADAQALVPVQGRPGGYRVVTALRLANGDVLPVVRGLTTSDSTPPRPPPGPQGGTGLLLPSEEAPTGDLPPGQISSVRLPTLAQTWPGPLVSGYVTLGGREAAAQGLDPAPVELPEASGRLRNGAYALQWWVFAGFAVFLAVRMARDLELSGAEPLDLTPEEPARPL
nr:SURF1 family protein [uncultured Friedmanniella sp.]